MYRRASTYPQRPASGKPSSNDSPTALTLTRVRTPILSNMSRIVSNCARASRVPCKPQRCGTSSST